MKKLDKSYFVYLHRRATNLSVVYYVGIGKRYRERATYGRNELWNRNYNKYGLVYEKIHEGLLRSDAEKLEEFYISMYGRMNLNNGSLANLTDGGEGTKNVVMSKARRKQIGDFFRGKKHTEQTKTKIRVSNTGKKFSEERKRKIGEASRKRGAGYLLQELHPRDQKWKDKIAAARSEPVSIKGIEFKSGKSASEYYGVTNTTICRWVKNPNKKDCFKL